MRTPPKYPAKDEYHKNFVLIGHEDYTTKAGKQVRLSVWQAPCRVCLEPFTIKAPERSERIDPDARKAYHQFLQRHCERDRRQRTVKQTPTPSIFD